MVGQLMVVTAFLFFVRPLLGRLDSADQLDLVVVRLIGGDAPAVAHLLLEAEDRGRLAQGHDLVPQRQRVGRRVRGVCSGTDAGGPAVTGVRGVDRLTSALSTPHFRRQPTGDSMRQGARGPSFPAARARIVPNRWHAAAIP